MRCNERTRRKVVRSAGNLDTAAGFFRRPDANPERASFNVDYDLHWRNPPRQPEQEATLNGILRTRLGKGYLPISVAVMPAAAAQFGRVAA